MKIKFTKEYVTEIYFGGENLAHIFNEGDEIEGMPMVIQLGVNMDFEMKKNMKRIYGIPHQCFEVVTK